MKPKRRRGRPKLRKDPASAKGSAGKATIAKARREKAGLLSMLPENTSQVFREAPKAALVKSTDFGTKKLLRVASIASANREKGVSQRVVNPRRPEAPAPKTRAGPAKTAKKTLKSFDFALGIEKSARGRRKIPSEVEETLDIEKPGKAAPAKREREGPPEKQVEANVPSIDPQKGAEHPKPRPVFAADGELSFKLREETGGVEFTKPSKFSFDARNTTFAELGRESGTGVFHKKNTEEARQERERENKEILSKMREPVLEKPECEAAVRNPTRASENSSHARDDEDTEEFPFHKFGF